MHQTPFSMAMDHDQLRVVYRGDISKDAALSLRETIPALVAYYGYRRVTWLWDSPGGEVAGAQVLWQLMQALRASGVRQGCQASRKAMSAAAFLLTLGDWGARTVQPDTELLYHQARLITPEWASIDRSLAADIQRQLGTVDEALLQSIVSHLMPGGNPAPLRQKLATRKRWLLEHWSQVQQAWQQRQGFSPTENWLKKPPSWASDITLDQAKASGDTWLKQYRKTLKQELAKDLAVPPLRAWCLGLIDHVEGITPSPDELDRYARAQHREIETDASIAAEAVACEEAECVA